MNTQQLLEGGGSCYKDIFISLGTSQKMGKKWKMNSPTGMRAHILMAKQGSWRTKHCEHHKVYLLGMFPQQQIKQWKKPGSLGYIDHYKDPGSLVNNQ